VRGDRGRQGFELRGWTEWCLVSNLKFTDLTRGAGVCVISAGAPLCRAAGSDPMGILDIGESVGLRTQIRAFVRCATQRGKEGHMAGWRYRFFRFDRPFAFSDLRIRWTECSSKAHAREIEGRTMLTCLTRHSELPPLNYAFNWSPFKTDGGDLFDRLLEGNSATDGE